MMESGLAPLARPYIWYGRFPPYVSNWRRSFRPPGFHSRRKVEASAEPRSIPPNRQTLTSVLSHRERSSTDGQKTERRPVRKKHDDVRRAPGRAPGLPVPRRRRHCRRLPRRVFYSEFGRAVLSESARAGDGAVL